jgi:toxin ParE1/3/4
LTPIIHKHEAAKLDLVDHAVYLIEEVGLDVAERFLNNAESTFTDLAREPLMGSPLHLKNPRLAQLRKWRVKGFDHHLVFYEAAQDGIAIVRVLHSSSDWWRLLGMDQ